jgi:hypothetical protein
MGIRISLLILFSSVITACAPQNTHKCPGSNPGIVPININYNGATINVAPDPQSAGEGDVIQFNIVGAENKRVSISGKTPIDGWLNGSGKKKPGKPASEKFFVCVPTDLFEGDPPELQISHKDFGYNVNVEGKPEKDPVVRVRRN